MQNGRIWAINQGVKFFILGANVHNPRGANGLLLGANGLQPSPVSFDYHRPVYILVCCVSATVVLSPPPYCNLPSGQFQTSTVTINGVISIPGGSGHVRLFFFIIII
jgi:hypothetical protein